MNKADGAFLTISELANELHLPQHILRYWESRFPELKPLQRSGNRRYYRPADVALARRIHHLLNVEGFTVKGARKALNDGGASPPLPDAGDNVAESTAPNGSARNAADLLPELEHIRARLAQALAASQ
ncbi:MerR family transcriptional regulator [Rhizorhapis sp. SPR117]|uniref:MerR family transcriptional regulator n=1 Tax=Rhizorhapis sp. SPR117 TaxID=2912611 RepID=UPI001F1A36A6|nr:MerR family transcriptional regulator [Rhizorhapis sp. SPR117]